MNREIYLVLIAIAVSLQVSFAQTQADSLESTKLIEINTEPFSWETQWQIWCESQDCVSSDTSLWNIIGEPHLELDTTVMKSRMAIVDMSSALNLSWNPISHTRVALYVDRRKRGLGTMLGRAPAFLPLFE